MAKIKFSRNAEKDFDRLPKSQKKKLVKKIKTLQKEPFSGKKLVGKLEGLLSLRAWPYRIIYEIDKSKNVNILSILHRQKAYKG
jgi:addiction module RelE/StbE family toxin